MHKWWLMRVIDSWPFSILVKENQDFCDIKILDEIIINCNIKN